MNWRTSLSVLGLILVFGCTQSGSSSGQGDGGRATRTTRGGAATETLDLDKYWWPSNGFMTPINRDFKGVTCFRGNPQRNYVGEGPIPTGNVRVLWRQGIGQLRTGHWNGVGWTGQPLIVAWPNEVRKHMNFLKQPGPEMEVIGGALDGQVHFFDAKTGKRSRKPLKMPYDYPIKGTVSVDPRGYPLIYVGCGINAGIPGYRIFSLISFKELLCLPANDPKAPRKWAGSDSNALMLRDTLFEPTENGWFNRVKLNTTWDPKSGKIAIKPEVLKVAMSKPGIESSMAVWNNLGFVADNAGYLYRVWLDDPRKFRKIKELGDDTDSTCVLDAAGNLYVGIEKDKRTGANAKGIIYKLNPSDGKVIWKWEFAAGSITKVGPGQNPINGGILSTGALWPEGQTIFYTTSHHPNVGRGQLIALDTQSGKMRWSKRLHGFSWSSPITVGGVVFCADSTGTGYIVDAKTGDSLLTDASGQKVESMSLGGNTEGSPIVWQGRIYVGTRGGSMICLGVK